MITKNNFAEVKKIAEMITNFESQNRELSFLLESKSISINNIVVNIDACSKYNSYDSKPSIKFSHEKFIKFLINSNEKEIEKLYNKLNSL